MANMGVILRLLEIVQPQLVRITYICIHQAIDETCARK